MAQEFEVTFSKVKDVANDLKTKNRSLRKEIDNMKSIEKTLNGQWDGQANDNFHKAFTKDMTQFTNFCNAIDQYVTKLNEINNKYETAEKRAADIASKRSY